MRWTVLALLAAAMSTLPVHHVIAQAAPGRAGRGELLAGPARPVARFVADYFTPQDKVASFALLKPLSAAAGNAGQLPGSWRISPSFEKLPDGRHRMTIPIEAGTSLYGTGEASGPLLRNGRTTMMWNTDAYGYGVDTPALYKSLPYVLAVRADGTSFGVMYDSTWRTEVNLDGAITFTSEGNPPEVYVWERATPQEVTKTLAELTGTMPLPPRWALGYHQCRYSYYPEARVREVAAEFRKRNIPASVLWFDIDYMRDYRVFTFDPSHFPDPKKLNDDLDAMGFKRIWMINPGVKDEKGFFVRDQLVEAGFQVMTAAGETYRGAVWPGMCVFPDYTSPAVRAWWAGLYKSFMAQGIDGVWNDMNEPAIFNVASKTMPEDNRHRGGEYRAHPDSPPVTVSAGDHARFHNVYGLLMSQATLDGIAAANPDKRPFVLTRAGAIGSHRYVASWSGDNTADWAHLEMSIPMTLNMGLSGWAFTGPDIGGFISNGPNSFEGERGMHFARWMGVGSLLPFCRGHTGKGNIDKEPWSFGPDVERACRIALQRRSRFMPYLYTLFHEASTNGMPVARPVFFADPADPALRSEDDCFLLGDAVLVSAQLMPDRSRRHAMPKGIWRPFDVISDNHPDNPLLYLRGGHIVPVGPIANFEGEKPLDPLTLVVSLDAKGSASGRLYEDAGEGFDYRKGQYLLTTYKATTVNNTVVIEIASAEGKMPRPSRALEVLVMTDSGARRSVGARDGEKIIIPLTDNR